MLRKFLSQAHEKIFPTYYQYLGEELRGCKTVLDLGCGSNSSLQSFSKKFYSVGVDVFPEAVARSRKKGIHNKYIVGDVTKIKFKSKSFECVLALELLEHLPKQKAIQLIKKMILTAKKKVIISTPNGFVSQHAYDENPYQVHKSSFSADDFRKIGFEVRGVSGLRYLRGELGELRFRPKFFWRIISDITQKFVAHCPDAAYQLFCVKRLSEK